jgi:16S rRNA processing protein RimM
MGRVTRAHGITGELEVRPDWEHSRGLLAASEVFLEAESGALGAHRVRASRQTPKGLLLRLEGIDDRNAAEACAGNVVRVARDALPKLKEGEYYLCDLVGARVVSAEGPIGEVVEVQMYPSVDAVVIEAPDGARFEQPLLDEWIARVDVLAREITLSSPDGLIETPRGRASRDEGE